MPTESSKELPAKQERAAQVTFYGQVQGWFLKNAKTAIVAVSGLIVIGVLLIANHFWSRVRVERGMLEIEQADSTRDLESLKSKYKDAPDLLARLTYQLASAYYSDGRLDDARREYEEFSARFSAHPLHSNVQAALHSIARDKEFLEKDKPGLISQHSLLVHPALLRERGEKSPYGPLPPRVSEITLDLGKGFAVAELYLDDAPKSAHQVQSLIDKEYFKDLKFARRPDGKGWEIEERKTNPSKEEVEFETTTLPVVKGSIVLVRTAEGRGVPARFHILTEDAPELQGQVTVIGEITDRFNLIQELTPEDSVRSIRVIRRPAGAVVERPDPPKHDHDHDHDHGHDHKH
jgi:cyclophilin family peptidyl-prolyl cis-trans isomerase